MAKSDVPHCCRHRAGGPYFYQRAVPEGIRHRFGCNNLQVPLGTDSPSVAERRKAIIAPRVEALFAKARAGTRIKASELDALQATFGRHGPLTAAEEAALELRELNATYEWLAEEPLDHPQLLANSLLAVQQQTAFMTARAAGTIAVAEPIALGSAVEVIDMEAGEYAKALLQEIGVKATPEALAKVQVRIARASQKALALWDRKLQPPPISGAPLQRHAGGQAPKVSETAAQYMGQRQRDKAAALTAQTAAQMTTTFRLFADHVRDARMDEITREDSASFLDTLARLHRHYGHRPGAAKLKLAELLRQYPAAEGEGLSNRTLNRHQTALLGLFKWARKHSLVNGTAENPFADMARPEAKQSEVGYKPFEIAELKALFRDERFEVRPERHTFNTARPWVGAVALFSGMRMGEILELDAEDVKRDRGVWYFDVAEGKTEAGIRRVPVHSELVALGFLDYVKAIGKGPLFAGVTPRGLDKERAHTFASRFPEFRRGRGITRDRVAFHSFRKNFVGALEKANIDRDRAALVVGHERGFTFRVYNPEGVDMPALREVVEAVKYPGLKLTR